MLRCVFGHASVAAASLLNFMMPAKDVTQPTPRVRSASSLTIYLASDLKAPLLQHTNVALLGMHSKVRLSEAIVGS